MPLTGELFVFGKFKALGENRPIEPKKQSGD